MKIKTENLTGAALDWVVTKCELPSGWPGAEILLGNDTDYSSDWFLGGPIIEREGIELSRAAPEWSAYMGSGVVKAVGYGSTPLIAAMRAYVASKLGAEVEIPNELMEK